jgi:hypothetical protein
MPQERWPASGKSVKDLIAGQIDAATRECRIHWDGPRVVDRPMPIGPLPARVRFVPTFAYRQLLYDSPVNRGPLTGCRLCHGLEDTANEIRLPPDALDPADRRWLDELQRRLLLRHNNFPYFRSQLLLARPEHVEAFASTHHHGLLDFMQRTGFRSAAMQVSGSGATIPHHAHISVSDESLPIFEMPVEPWTTVGTIRFGRVCGYPGALYVVGGGRVIERARWLRRLVRRVTSAGLSYNLFLTARGSAYLLLRSAEFSPSIQRKVGSVEAAGVFLGNALGVASQDLDELEAVIRDRCDQMTASQFLAALVETVCGWGAARFLESYILRPRPIP